MLDEPPAQDLVIWMAMITAMTFCFAASLYSYSSMLGELEIMKVACNFYGDGGFWSYLYQLNEILIGGAAPLECFKDADFTVLVVMVELRRRPKTPLAVMRPRAEVRATTRDDARARRRAMRWNGMDISARSRRLDARRRTRD